MVSLCDHEKCTGCGACASVCPSGCIRMEPDDEGFIHPVVDKDRCVGCGACAETCPVLNLPEDDRREPEAFAVRIKDDQILKISSSGGLFSLLSKAILDGGGSVFGAVLDEDQRVVHNVARSGAEIGRMLGSKYVQSFIGDTYLKVKEELSAGREVLFTGTPCQVAGLLAFLGEVPPGLYTADMICHGAPSPAIWKKYVSFRESVSGSKTESVAFRDKRSGWKKYSVVFRFSDGSEYASPLTEDMYMRAFIMDMTTRRSCSDCPFRKVHRASDVTMADFWGVESVVPSLADDRGASLLLIHSEKGAALAERIKGGAYITKVGYSDAVAHNRSATESSAPSPARARFIAEALGSSFDKAYEKYCGNGFSARLRRHILKFINR